MFKHIYDFSVKNNLCENDERYQQTSVKYCIIISTDGKFIGIEEEKDSKMNQLICPRFPSRSTMSANGKAHFLVDKCNIVLNPSASRHDSYLKDLKSASEISKECLLIYNLLSDESIYQIPEIVNLMNNSVDKVGFKIDGEYITEKESWKPYFEKEYNRVVEEDEKKNGGGRMISVITGEEVNAVTVLDNFTVLGVTDGKGDYLASFKQDSFSSYNLDRALHCAMSKNEMSIINEGIKYLLTNNYHKKWGIVVWYEENERQYDVIDLIFNPYNSFLSEQLGEMEDLWNDKERPLEDRVLYDFLHGLLQCGKLTQDFSQIKGKEYYSFGYTSCRARSAFSDFRIRSLDNLFENLLLFYEDSLLNRTYWIKEDKKTVAKNEVSPIFNFNLILKHCARPKRNTTTNRLEPAGFDQVDNEFNMVKKQKLLDSIMGGKQLPMDCLRKAVMNISKYKVADQTPPSTLYQILKVYINRENKKKGEECFIMPTLNKDNKSVAYNCGRLLCVYERVQMAAMQDVNVSVSNKYYSSASTSPAYVFGRLATNANYHLQKINNDKLEAYYRKMLCEIAANIKNFPKTFTITEQAEFALGYYQQEQAMFEKKTDLKNKEANNE